MRFPAVPQLEADPPKMRAQLQAWIQEVAVAFQTLDRRVKMYTVAVTGGSFPILLDIGRAVKPDGAWLVRAEQLVLPGSTNAGDLFLDWDWYNAQLRIRNIASLVPGTRYEVTVAVSWQE